MPIEQPGRIRGINIEEGSVRARALSFSIQSDNYVPGIAGWKISRGSGDVEFNEGAFRGDVTISGDLEVSGSDGILVTNGGDITIAAGGDLIISGGQLTSGPTTLNASGLQVGSDVVIDATGLNVIGGLVTPLWVQRYGADSTNNSLTTSFQMVNDVTVTPPSWVQTAYLLMSHYSRMGENSVASRTLVSRLDIGGGGFSTVQFNAGTGGPGTNSSSKQSTASVSSFPVTVKQEVRVLAGTNGDNDCALSVVAFGIRN